MANKDIHKEIEELKAQLAALSCAGGPSSRAGGAPESGTSPESGASPDSDVGGWLRDAMKQAEEVLGGLDLHLKDVPAKTALIIFALGVLTGRLLSRRGD